MEEPKSYKITKILNYYKNDKKRRILIIKFTLKKLRFKTSIELLIFWDEFLIGLTYNNTFKESRSFCLVFCSVLIVDLILFLNL